MIPTGAPNQARGTARLTRTFGRYVGVGGALPRCRRSGDRAVDDQRCPGDQLRRRGNFDNDALNQLHAEGFEHPVLADDWLATVDQHSLGWVCALSLIHISEPTRPY